MKKSILCVVLLVVILFSAFTAFPSGAAESNTDTLATTSGGTSPAIGEMKISAEGLELIKNFEGFAQFPYEDYSHWSIGYGSYVCPIEDDPYEIYPNGISHIEADEMLMQTVGNYINAVNNFAREYNIPLTQNQFEALVSFTYNLGANIWKRDLSSFTIKRLLVEGDYTPEEMQDAFYMWRNAGGKENAGLAKRRLREATLFNSDINMSDPASDGYDVKYYIVDTNLLTVRVGESTSSSTLGSIRRNTVIPIVFTNSAGDLGFTTFAAFYGWVSLKNLVPIEEKGTVSVLDDNDLDEQGIFYTFDESTMTATVGNDGTKANNSKYAGMNSGYVYLTRYIFRDGKVYTLTDIGENAFSGCKYLKKIYIPASITHIAENAFDKSALGDIYYPGGSYAEEYAKNSPYKGTNYNCKVSHTYGSWYVFDVGDENTPHTDESRCSVCGDVRYRTATSIFISSMPAKIEYYVGDEFDLTGIKVSARFDDGNTAVVTEGITFGGFDSSTLGAKDIIVKYGPFETSFKIRVNQKTLTGITITKTPKVTSFVEGTSVDYTGLQVTAHYDNNTSEIVNEYDVSECDINTVGKQTITVTYNGFKASFSITIKAKSVTSVTIIADPYKTEYYCGESFDPEGIQMRVNYDNGTTDVVEKGFTITGFDSSKPGKSQIKVYYGGKYKSLSVLIILNKFVSDKYGINGDPRCLVEEGTTAKEFLLAFDASDRIEIVGIDGKALRGSDLVGSGCKAILWYNEDRLAELDIAVKGDLNGDGEVALGDYLMMNHMFVGSDKNFDVMIHDINGDGQVTLADLVCLLSKIKAKNEDEQNL